MKKEDKCIDREERDKVISCLPRRSKAERKQFFGRKGKERKRIARFVQRYDE